MWRPDAVVTSHKRRGIALWIFMIFGIVAYTTWIIRGAMLKLQDPDTSLVLSNEVYDYPDIWVCLYNSYGCDKQEREEGCANSSRTIEGMRPTMVFYPNATTDNRRQEIVGYSTLTENLGHCVVFNSSQVTQFRGNERDPAIYLDYFLLNMYWYPGGSANASTTCVSDGEMWDSHKEWVYLFLHDPSKKTTSSGIQISYSCINSGSDNHVFTSMGLGLTEEHNLEATDTRSYKALSTSPSIFKDKVNGSIFTPYAYLAMEIQQEPNSMKIITEIDPLDVAEMLGNVGGFWDLILILWPIFFVAATRESPTLKPRNLRKTVTKAAERAKKVTPAVGFPRTLKRTMSMDALSSKTVSISEETKEAPYWDAASAQHKLDHPKTLDV